VLATEFFWRQSPTPGARKIFLREVCPGLEFDRVGDWEPIDASAGLTGLESETDPFEMMTARGFLGQMGLDRCLAIRGSVASRPARLCEVAWLMPGMDKSVPCLGYIGIAGTKPR
jgi:hypothetical protein